MASSPKESRKVLEGIFAINKPQWASSAGVLRDLQTHFDKSPLFAPWLTHTKRSMEISNSKRKHIDNLKVKLGHGGTLDPLATGVLIVGVGRGTKCLSRFIKCTKSYECVILFGAATDSYDAVGKIVSKGDYAHVTKELVEEKLEQFRGKIMQKPSVFSALKVDGKKMYEYARAGGDIPEVLARPVEVEKLELVEWLESGSHEFTWPKEEVDGAERVGAEKLLGIRQKDTDFAAARGKKRSRSPEDELVSNEVVHTKKLKDESEVSMSGALPTEDTPTGAPAEGAPTAETQTEAPSTAAIAAGAHSATSAQTSSIPDLDNAAPEATTTVAGETIRPDSPDPDVPTPEPASENTTPPPQPPAARLRMTVTSGFYVRSLCHDLGLACNSLGIMSSLVRTRQDDYELGKNVLEASDLDAGADVWEPKVQKYLEEFMEKEGWKAEEVVENDEEWEAKIKEARKDRRENDRDRSFRGKGRGGRNWQRR
ncbi:pseudouridine synthase [Bimuria novae-zelandiae CBS 107.79]|uniref:tRNA pseudouridine(55) synthase n=1 Tax=Bimuria novae-zelandiae CBS 107.79 TaxID=1447943 RepID=A0A6A5VFJ1_9PLEO|nr:pseudouridine synthase [Bimuria novae-zelandiae CBS 107.79]